MQQFYHLRTGKTKNRMDSLFRKSDSSLTFCKMLRIKRIPRISRHFHWKHKVRIPSCKKALSLCIVKPLSIDE